VVLGIELCQVQSVLEPILFYLRVSFMFLIFRFHCYVKQCELCKNMVAHNYVHTL